MPEPRVVHLQCAAFLDNRHIARQVYLHRLTASIGAVFRPPLFYVVLDVTQTQMDPLIFEQQAVGQLAAKLAEGLESTGLNEADVSSIRRPPPSVLESIICMPGCLPVRQAVEPWYLYLHACIVNAVYPDGLHLACSCQLGNCARVQTAACATCC